MTTKIPNPGKMPKSDATYKEYEEFLAKYDLTYSHFEFSKDRTKSKKCKEIFLILENLAKNSNVNLPKDIIANNSVVLYKFASSDEAKIDLLKFYQHFRNTHWNKKDAESVEKLTAILNLPIMQF